MTRNEAIVRMAILSGVIGWCSVDVGNQLPRLRVLSRPIRTPGFGYLKAICLGPEGEPFQPNAVSFAFIGRHDRTYNPHSDKCWTNQEDIPARTIQNILNSLLRR